MNDYRPPFPKNPLYGEVPPDSGEEPLEPGTLIIEDEMLRRGFTAIPNYILEDRTLSIPARFTYMILLSFAWKTGSCFPGQSRLAYTLGVSRQMVSRYLEELRDKKYIDWKRRGLGRTNLYRILKVHAKDEADVNYSLHQDVKSVSHPNVNPVLHKEYTGEKDSEEEYSEHSKLRKASNPSKIRVELPKKRREPLNDPPMREVEIRPGQEYPVSKVAQVIDSLSKNDLHDPTHIQSNITRATNLWKTSRLSEDQFINLIREAKRKSLDHTGTIRKQAGYLGFKNHAPYFFQVLKDLVQQESIQAFRRGFGATPSDSKR